MPRIVHALAAGNYPFAGNGNVPAGGMGIEFHDDGFMEYCVRIATNAPIEPQDGGTRTSSARIGDALVANLETILGGAAAPPRVIWPATPA